MLVQLITEDDMKGQFMLKILAFAGSLRKDSYNKTLVNIAAEGARQAGADVTVVSLSDYPMPVLNQDDEAVNGKPEAAKKLKALMIEHDGFLIACPEYNSSITAALKNAIDWTSRPDEGDPPGGLAAYNGKVVSLMSASPGALGGLRGLVHVRAILGNIGCIVLPKQVAIAKAHEAFNDDGTLSDERQHASVVGLGTTLAETLEKLNRGSIGSNT